jgi:hypothetical protein
MAGIHWQLRDLLSDHQYVRSGDTLQNPGLYLDLGAYDYHVFRLQAHTTGGAMLNPLRYPG